MSIKNPIYTPNSIRTFTGKVFDLKLMALESISIDDIAHALSNTMRFAGHLKVPYSVAQHSVMVAKHASKENKLAALLHDASEAYIGDMPSPFKKMMPEYKVIEGKLMKVIAEVFSFEYPLNPEIKEIDKNMLVLEWAAFVEDKLPLECWSAEQSKREFLAAYNNLSN